MMTTATTYRDSWKKGLLLSTILLGLACKTTISGDTIVEQSVSLGSDGKITWSKAHLEKAYRQISENLAYSIPSPAAISAIQSASSLSAARQAYEDAIDDLAEENKFKTRLQEYFFKHLQVGSFSGSDAENLPANTLTWTILNGLPMSDSLTRVQGFGPDGSDMAAGYTNGPADAFKSGYLTQESYVKKHMDQASFSYINRTLHMNLCIHFPTQDSTVFNSWGDNQIGVLYTVDVVNDLDCRPCHKNNGGMNLWRGATHDFTDTGDFVANSARGSNQWGQEDNTFDLEPKDESGNTLSAANSEAYFTPVKGFGTVLSPADMANAMISTPYYASCWTERMLSILFNLEEGVGGIADTVVPDNFSATDLEKTFFARWLQVMKDEQLVAKNFMVRVLKHDDYLLSVGSE
ncbi:MAG: hypothetical protein R3A11_04965 [Bdellovibrionota bacterium]